MAEEGKKKKMNCHVLTTSRRTDKSRGKNTGMYKMDKLTYHDHSQQHQGQKMMSQDDEAKQNSWEFSIEKAGPLNVLYCIGCLIYTILLPVPILSLSVPNPLPRSSQPSPNLHPTCFKPVPFLHPTSFKPAPNMISTFSEQGPNMLRVHKFKLIYLLRSLKLISDIFKG